MIRDVVVNLAIEAAKDPARDYAISLASATEAHLTGLAFAYEPITPGSIFDGVSASIIESHREASRRAATAATKSFDESSRRAGLNSDSIIVTASVDGCGETFARIGRNYDLQIVSQPKPDSEAPDDLIVEGALFGAGRPVLIVPYIQNDPFTLDHTLICWDGSRAAARAVGDAMPLISRSKRVEVVTIAAKDDKRNEIPGADIAQHLARHRLKVELKRIVAPDTDIGSTILSHAADSGTNLVVMGGYGHSRLREFVLGGATREMLRTMTVPVLMSH